jgi:hypothetical protein
VLIRETLNGVESHKSQYSVLSYFCYTYTLFLKCKMKMFVDDTIIWKRVRMRDDGLELQRDIDILDAWTGSSLLSFNRKKCKVMSVGHSLETRYYMGANEATTSCLRKGHTRHAVGQC